MSSHVIVAAIVVIALAGSPGCDRAEPQPPMAQTTDPTLKLWQMSDTLARARQLTFKATRRLDAALVDGGAGDPTDINVAVSRPRMVRARMVSPAGVRDFYADGRRMSLLDERMKLYATTPALGTIDQMVNHLDRQFGFTPPLAEFVLDDPYRTLNSDIQRAIDWGHDTVDHVECDHFTLIGGIADADLWVATSDHLPRRFVATFKARKGSPRLTVTFSEWNVAAKLADILFMFDPPTDAERVTMVAADESPANATADQGNRGPEMRSRVLRRTSRAIGAAAFPATVAGAATRTVYGVSTTLRTAVVAAPARRPVVAALPSGYRVTNVRGARYYYVGRVAYRAEFYEGRTVYVRVRL